jgi:hypothetical protein
MLSAVPAHDTPGVDRMLAKADLAFERNEGQFDSKVKFLARGQGYGLFLTRDEAILRFTTPKSDTIRMKFLGQKGNVPVSGLDELAGTTNYLLGNRATQSNIHSYKKVRYSEIYPASTWSTTETDGFSNTTSSSSLGRIRTKSASDSLGHVVFLLMTPGISYSKLPAIRLCRRSRMSIRLLMGRSKPSMRVT